MFIISAHSWAIEQKFKKSLKVCIKEDLFILYQRPVVYKKTRFFLILSKNRRVELKKRPHFRFPNWLRPMEILWGQRLRYYSSSFARKNHYTCRRRQNAYCVVIYARKYRPFFSLAGLARLARLLSKVLQIARPKFCKTFEMYSAD